MFCHSLRQLECLASSPYTRLFKNLFGVSSKKLRRMLIRIRLLQWHLSQIRTRSVHSVMFFCLASPHVNLLQPCLEVFLTTSMETQKTLR
ncbi:hypothetical protein EJ05DRAFT_7430 [Pseudovirgaria hyperparasitica]|uniref:Uncharacterized protein n=1 Tax=Pseudovirgaria hyperparasitica TaxID=470096 RepID=A0A6A6WKA9_9PEZI|nr:uncharacterized protein EJ05DRAFT_7430 [Pseudovirgaria hyperparasitica]KAF2762605.1 hypothetical protein EJ05DRAFT_7430 [Pseudovirgaria hyperparasitica]